MTPDELYGPEVCGDEDAADDILYCERCGEEVDGEDGIECDGDMVCPACADIVYDHDCPLCQGTGIGQHGDPDTSRCSQCRGSGVRKAERDDYDEEPDDYEY